MGMRLHRIGSGSGGDDVPPYEITAGEPGGDTHEAATHVGHADDAPPADDAPAAEDGPAPDRPAEGDEPD
jgi:hypothetical protein